MCHAHSTVLYVEEVIGFVVDLLVGLVHVSVMIGSFLTDKMLRVFALDALVLTHSVD